MSAEQPHNARALPLWAIRSLEIGLEGKPDARKVWAQFVRIAMSAQRRGWTEAQFCDEVWSTGTRTIKGHRVFGHWPLTNQLLTSVNGSKKRAHADIDRSWAAAADNLLSGGTLTTSGEFIDAAIDNAIAWCERLDEHLDRLSVTQELVMRYVCESVIKRRNSKVTCPCREVGSATGLPYRTANYTLGQLAKQGYLIKHDAGRHSNDPRHRRAAIYSPGDLPSWT
ncbi:hypothetical protein [Mycolicibacterium fortuitum]|uniref:hypothetical protein n=1 Tax=Mycolicibacterium fortuitum TaxID=1766 RepID=UPI0014907B6D|nr:hypothetical protein [Mycolicibacterium fortuitum]NOR01358.1 hypothetical protein [Mycolicibacterium fortuitum]